MGAPAADLATTTKPLKFASIDIDLEIPEVAGLATSFDFFKTPIALEISLELGIGKNFTFADRIGVSSGGEPTMFVNAKAIILEPSADDLSKISAAARDLSLLKERLNKRFNLTESLKGVLVTDIGPVRGAGVERLFCEDDKTYKGYVSGELEELCPT